MNQQLIISLSGIISLAITVYALGFKWISSRDKRKLQIGVEEAKQNSVGKDRIDKLCEQFEKLKFEIREDKIAIQREVEIGKDEIKEIRKQWVEYRDESRRNSEEQRRTAQQWTELFSTWADGLKETRDYINKNK